MERQSWHAPARPAAWELPPDNAGPDDLQSEVDELTFHFDEDLKTSQREQATQRSAARPGVA